MLKALGWRALSALGVLFVVSLLIFAACERLPGDVAQMMLGEYVTEENAAKLREELGLNQPAAVRYADWLTGMVRGDWGNSYTSRRPVAEMLPTRAANTALLTGMTALLAVPLSLTLGIFMALRAGTAVDRGLSVILLALAATPEFLLATAGVLLLSVKLQWLPAVSNLGPEAGVLETARALLLPVVTLTIGITAQIARMTRTTLVNLRSRPYIEMATLKGAFPLRVLLVHSLANTVGPLANIVALNVAYLISGVVVVETIFAMPGLAQLMINAVNSRDMPVIQACAMIFCVGYVLMVLLADMLGTLFNPRLRRTGDA